MRFKDRTIQRRQEKDKLSICKPSRLISPRSRTINNRRESMHRRFQSVMSSRIGGRTLINLRARGRLLMYPLARSSQTTPKHNSTNHLIITSTSRLSKPITNPLIKASTSHLSKHSTSILSKPSINLQIKTNTSNHSKTTTNPLCNPISNLLSNPSTNPLIKGNTKHLSQTSMSRNIKTRTSLRSKLNSNRHSLVINIRSHISNTHTKFKERTLTLSPVSQINISRIIE